MAKKSTTSASSRTYLAKPKKKRAGVHAKSKTSSNKRSKNYSKRYNGQG